MRNFAQVNRKEYNVVHVNGVLYDIKNFNTFVDKNGMENINTTLAVAVDENLGTIVNVSFSFVKERWGAKPDAKENPAFATLKAIKANELTVQKVGKEGAMRVRIDGSIAKNDYVGRDGSVVEQTVINGTFIHDDVRDFGATFQADMLLTSYQEKESRDGSTYGELGGYVFNFRNEFLPVRFNVPANVEGAMPFFESLEISGSNPSVMNIEGKITTTTIKSTSEGAFGVRASSRSLTTWDVTFGNEVYDFDSVISMDEIKAGLQERETHLADVRRRYEERQASKAAGASNSSPFVKTGTDMAATAPYSDADMVF